MVASADHMIKSDLIVGGGKLPLLYQGTGLLTDPANPLVMDILTGTFQYVKFCILCVLKSMFLHHIPTKPLFLLLSSNIMSAASWNLSLAIVAISPHQHPVPSWNTISHL